MRTIKSVASIRKAVKGARLNGQTIGFVPTMGALHNGHLSLIQKARKENDIVVLSIFVNPIQFAPNEDFEKYPRDLKRDQCLAKRVGVDFVFYPQVNDIYPKPYFTYVNVVELTDGLCGSSRAGHFDGVTTIVAKLFNIVLPDIAYFGQKDFQQFTVIKQMVKDLNMPLRVKSCPIVREKDGLAMSSRNAYLTLAERKSALKINISLNLARNMIKKGETDSEKIINLIKTEVNNDLNKIDYIEIVDCNTLKKVNEIGSKICIAIACFVGKTRLIDNIVIH